MAEFVVSISFAYIGDYIFVRYTDARYEVLVSEFYDNLMGKDISFFRAHRTGTLNSLFRDYMDGTINIFRLMRTGVFPLLISSLAPLFVLCYFDWRVAAVFCCTMGLRCYLSYIFTPRIESARDEALSVYRELSGKMSDQIAHFPIVRASANYEINRSKITSLASDEGRLFWESHSTAMLSDCLQSVLTAACFVSTFVVISISTLAGTISLEVSILSVFFIIQGMQAASTTGDLVQSFIKRRGQVRSALRSLESDTTRQPWEEATKSSLLTSGELQFCSVAFSYHTEDRNIEVYRSLDLHIPHGVHVAVMGDNGAGKSTLLNLLMRFDVIGAGKIVLGGRNLYDLSAAHLYTSISYVPQQITLFNESILDNIKFFSPNATDEQISTVCNIVGISGFLKDFPEGLSTKVGEFGSKLSGGQRQRIIIARAREYPNFCV